MSEKKNTIKQTLLLIASVIFACGALFCLMFAMARDPKPAAGARMACVRNAYLMDRFDDYVESSIAPVEESLLQTKKVFWIPEDAQLAPLPNSAAYGLAKEASELKDVLEAAEPLLDGQELLFQLDTPILEGFDIHYYADDSILAITWHQVVDNSVFTICEVKVSHPSQFRRYLANNEYNSDYMYPVSRMGLMNNAVVASAADYYRGRNHGIIVYEGEVKRTNHSDLVDACFIDENGDLILVPAGQLNSIEQAQAFVDENDISFSIAFGPILVNDGVRCEPESYYLGEAHEEYPRAVLCQMDELHYLVVVVNAYYGYFDMPTIRDLAENIMTLGCDKAYTLDGGRTGNISMQGKHLNPLQGAERWLSDMIYFATAIPSEEVAGETEAP